MKVGVCTGSRCSFYGASFMIERLEELQEEIMRMNNIKDDFTLEIEILPCVGECKGQEEVSPIVYIDGEMIRKASTPQVMERIMNEAMVR